MDGQNPTQQPPAPPMQPPPPAPVQPQIQTPPQIPIQPPPPPSPFARLWNFFQQLSKQNKTLVVGLIFAVLVAATATTYTLIAASKKSNSQQLFAPATQEISPEVLPDTPTPIPPTPTPFSSTGTIVTPAVTIISPTPVPDPTANWNTYPNSVYGYSIKYPPFWNVTNLGPLEPQVPNYVVFNQNTSSSSARFITISVSTRTFEQQVLIGGVTGNPITVDGIEGTQQNLQDSNGNETVVVILPLPNSILILRAQTAYTTIFNQMLSTLNTNL